MHATTNLQVRVRPGRYRLYARHAKGLGVTLADWVRVTLDTEMKRVAEDADNDRAVAKRNAALKEA